MINFKVFRASSFTSWEFLAKEAALFASTKRVLSISHSSKGNGPADTIIVWYYD